jgi:Xaa-Pro aminopeptidase
MKHWEEREMRIFSDVEMRRRTAGIVNGLAERDLEVAFLHSADNVYYTTGVPLLSAWGRPMWAVLGASDDPIVIGAMLEKETMERYGTVSEVRTYDDGENVWNASVDIVADLIRSRGRAANRVGVERSILSVGVAEALESRLDAELVDVSDILSESRIVKSEEEIKVLRLGGQIAKIGANAFVGAVAAGASELTVAAHAVAAMDTCLAGLYPDGATSTYAYCQVGDHSLTPHLHPTGRRIRRGDVIALNVFPVIWGYCMELERTYVFGEPSERQRDLMAAVDESFQLGKRLLEPDRVISELHRECSAVLERAGYGQYMRHGTGHAHGIMIGAAGREELGELRPYNHGRLRPGMLNSVEPGVYVPEEGGFRHSDVMLITPSGAECLTEFPIAIEF